jgi:hypothetical protein
LNIPQKEYTCKGIYYFQMILEPAAFIESISLGNAVQAAHPGSQLSLE